MTHIWSRLWDSRRSVIAEPAVGRAPVPAPSEDTLNLPHATAQWNRPDKYVGLRRDIKARNRQAGPRRRTPGSDVAL